MSQPKFEELEVGQEVGTVEFLLTRDSLVRYAGASGDFNPIHYDKGEAARQNLPDVIIAGPMKFAMLIDCLTDWAGGQRYIKKARCRYQGMDVPGTVFTMHAKVAEVDAATGRVELETWLVNQKGATTTVGNATLELPRKG